MYESNTGTNEFAEAEKKEVARDNKRNIVIISLFALLPVFVIVLIFYAYSKLSYVPSDEYDAVVEETIYDEDFDDVVYRVGEEGDFVDTNLEGKIYLTLSPFDSGSERLQTHIYFFDLATSELKSFFEIDDSHYNDYMSSFSPDLSEMIFVQEYEEQKSKIMMWNVDSEELLGLTSLLDFFARNPRFCAKGENIVFWGGTDMSTPENSSVYFVSLDGEKEELTRGAYPVCSPEGQYVLFLKNDGLYSFNLDTGEEKQAVDLTDEELFPGLNLSGMGWYGFRFNVSNNGELLAITNTLGGPSVLLGIDSWKPFEYELLKEFSFAQPLWPVFSPCNNYLAVQGFYTEGDYPTQLSIYDLDTLERVGGFSIEGFDLDYIWISDWIKK